MADLINLLPPFIGSFGEIKELMKVDGFEVDRINGFIETMYDNGFIDSCDEYGIVNYERLCGITPTTSQPLEERKLKVKIAWNNDIVPYTHKSLINQLNHILGVNNYQLDYDYNHYDIVVQVDVAQFSQLTLLNNTLDSMLPMNINVFVKLHYNQWNSVDGKWGDYVDKTWNQLKGVEIDE